MATTVVEYTQEKTHHQKRPFPMMGKSQKFSRGYPSSFVPDYRHEADTIGESEGLGSSCRADSEDSCTPKRKCISLNREKGDVFNIPLQVFSASKMSATERKGLELRLRTELEQIRALQKKLQMRNMGSISGVTLSSSRNSPGKKLGSNAEHLKRGTSGRFESKKQLPHLPQSSSSGSSHAATMKQCESILNKLMKHAFGWAFINPVDAVALNIPDYYTVIKHPMDFSTIMKRLTSGAYSSPWDFVADVRLTFTNAMTYNPPGNDFHTMADKMSKFFESRWKPIEKKLSLVDSSFRRETEAAKPVVQPKKRKASPANHRSLVPSKAKPEVTAKQKMELSDRLARMVEDMPEPIVDFLRMHNKVVNEAGEEEIEVDIDALSDDRLLELKVLLDKHSRKDPARQQQPKAEPCEMEILNESGVRMSSMHPCKGNEHAADEDVDIGGNDPPISSYPPVEIEKDAAPKSSKYSSSNSSSSDCSSSSDSDSGSSSGSDSDDRGASPGKIVEGNVRPDTAQGRDIMSRPDTKRENAPSERQVSPDKLYRAALLRSRFADTILKAREKTLDQVEKGDPEKLRREREEFERHQREEKARIQAKAKAAETARRRAETEAAAEAKRQREREREAARQALLKMERTVEINENCLILKDLEMLGSVPGDCEPNSIDETSPDHSQVGMGGGFKLLGSNPLEQLGLFMKEEDEEEEEDVEPRVVPPLDAEEGEIG